MRNLCKIDASNIYYVVDLTSLWHPLALLALLTWYIGPQTQAPNHGLVWPVIRVTIFTVSYSNIGICKWMCKCYGREVWISLVYFSQCLSVLVFSKKRNASLMQLALGFALKKLKLVKSNHQYNSCKQTLNTLGGLI